MPTASNSAERACAEICLEKLDTGLERTDNNHCLQTPLKHGGEIIPESGGAIISEQWGGFIGIGTPAEIMQETVETWVNSQWIYRAADGCDPGMKIRLPSR